MQRHRRVHTAEKPYECLNCPQVFARSDALACVSACPARSIMTMTGLTCRAQSSLPQRDRVRRGPSAQRFEPVIILARQHLAACAAADDRVLVRALALRPGAGADADARSAVRLPAATDDEQLAVRIVSAGGVDLVRLLHFVNWAALRPELRDTTSIARRSVGRRAPAALRQRTIGDRSRGALQQRLCVAVAAARLALRLWSVPASPISLTRAAYAPYGSGQ